MRIHLVVVGEKMPAWVRTAVAEYQARLPANWRFKLVEVRPEKRTKNSVPSQIKEQESARLLAAIPAGARTVALAIDGQPWDTPKLADNVRQWLQDGRDIALLIGGADGLAERVVDRSDWRWSLSALTFPHGLARVMVVEQLYRAATILANHPYHRG